MTSIPVRVRIAPSPTGYLHVGTARTALFNYLFARRTGGKFLIRIEDTDVARSQAELIDPILDALKWLGLTSDEPLVFQSKRTDLYAEYVKKIVASGHAYYCFSTPEEVEAERAKAREEQRQPKFRDRDNTLTPDELQRRIAAGESPVVRLRIPEGETSYDDLVSGHLTRQNIDIDDFVIARSDGTVTYNFAVVVDDHEMGITHVIRGNDHITNTFKQVILYKAFGFEPPVFGHVPLILRPDKKKVSKRLGDKDAGEYRREGILADAMVNYLALLGWSPKTDREIYTREELIAVFTTDNLTKANAVFDEEKLVAFNHAHIQMMSDHDLATLVAPLLVDAGLSTKYWLETRWEYLRTVVGVLKERARRLSDFVDMGKYFFAFEYHYDEDAAAKYFTAEASGYLDELAGRFEALGAFTHETTEAALTQLAEDKAVKKAVLIHPTRLAVSGVPAGPGLYAILVALGQPIVVQRLRKAVEHIRSKQ
jgi:nondiscriminating glutamyl-tRNA synthetase